MDAVPIEQHPGREHAIAKIFHDLQDNLGRHYSIAGSVLQNAVNNMNFPAPIARLAVG
jgi:hypothetical protein